MTQRALIIIDPLDGLHLKKDSSLAIIEAMQRQAWQVDVVQADHMYLNNDGVFANTASITIDLNSQPWYRCQAPQTTALSDYDVVVLRKDPPFDMAYIYLTYLLDFVAATKTLVINNPSSVRNANEKIFSRHFVDCTPPSVYSQDIDVLQHFIDEQQHVVIKPLDRMGGEGIFIIKHDDANRNALLQNATRHGQEMIVMQRFIPEISAGDKRILMINGEPLPVCLARIPADGDFRGNLAAGARGECRELNEREQWICQQVGPTLKQMGLFFVGLDIIGDYLTEINVTSPTCIREIEALSQYKVADAFVSQLANLIEQHYNHA